MIRAEKVSLWYEDHGRRVVACDSVDLEIKDGEFVGILGPSGSGKSSLLYLMSGLKQPKAGAVLYRDRDIAALTELERSTIRLNDFGFVFQFPYLLGYLTAIENVLLARIDRALPDEALELLREMNLGEKAHRFPHELSGGERQRVCVARALYGSPSVIFADEPTASLDHANGVQVVEAINQFRRNGALLMVTHDPSMLEGANRVVVLEEGRLRNA